MAHTNVPTPPLLTRLDGAARGVGGRRSDRDGRSQKLVAAGMKLFSERPYDAISIDDLVSEAGVAHGLVSYYFQGKRGLYLAVLGLVQADLEAITRPQVSDGALHDQMKGMARRHFEYFRAHPQIMLGLLASASHDPRAAEIARAAQMTGIGILLDMLGLPADPPAPLRIALRGCTGYLDQVTIDWLTHGQDVPIDNLVELCFDITAAAIASVYGRHVPGSVLDL